MEISPFSWSKIPELKSLLVACVSASSSLESVLPKIQKLIQQSPSSPESKQDIFNLILAMKMVNHFNLPQKDLSEVSKTRSLLARIELEITSMFNIQTAQQEALEEQFVWKLIGKAKIISSGNQLLRASSRIEEKGLALTKVPPDNEKSVKRNLTFGKLDASVFSPYDTEKIKQPLASVFSSGETGSLNKAQNLKHSERPVEIKQEKLDNEFANSNYKMVVRHSPAYAIQNFHHLEQATSLLKSAGVDLSALAQNLRRLDKTRMMVRSLQRVASRQQSLGLKLILDVKIRKKRALGNSHKRVKARLLLTYNQLFKKNKAPQQYFYNWYLRSNPRIMQKLTWHLLMKQKLSISVATYRLSYFLKFSSKKKTKDVDVLEGLCWLTRFYQRKNFVSKKGALDRLNPMSHNGKYFVLQRVWNTHTRLRAHNLKSVFHLLREAPRKTRLMFALFLAKSGLKLKDAFRNLRGFNRQEGSSSLKVAESLKNQKRDLLLLKILSTWGRSQSRTAYHRLQANKRRRDSKQAKQARVQSRLVSLLRRNSRLKLGEVLDRLRLLNRHENEKRDRETSLSILLWGKARALTNWALGKALRKLRANRHLSDLRKKYLLLMTTSLKGKAKDALRKLQKRREQNQLQERKTQRIIAGLSRKLVLKSQERHLDSFQVLRSFARQNQLQETNASELQKRTFKKLLVKWDCPLRKALHQLSNCASGVREAEEKHNKSSNHIFLNLHKTSKGKLKEALLKLRLSGKQVSGREEFRQKNGAVLARFLMSSAAGQKLLAMSLLRGLRRDQIQRETAGSKMALRLRLGQHHLLKLALLQLREQRQIGNLQREMEKVARDNEERGKQETKSKLAFMLIKALASCQFTALDCLRRLSRIGKSQSKLTAAGKPYLLLGTKMLSKQQLAFYKLLRCFGNGNPSQTHSRVRDSVSKSPLDGALSEDGQRKFSAFLGNLLGKPELKNHSIEQLQEFMGRRNRDGKYDPILERLAAGNNKDLGSLFTVLEEEAAKGSKEAEGLKQMVDGQDKLKVKNLGQFMEDNNMGGKYNQLLQHLESNPDLTLTELSAIIRRNHSKNAQLGALLEELEEMSEVAKILRFMKENNLSGVYSGLIEFVEKKKKPLLADLLRKIKADNVNESLSQLISHINTKDRKIRDRLRDQMLLANPGLNGEFSTSLELLQEARKEGLDTVYWRVKAELEQKRRSSKTLSGKLMARVALDKFNVMVNESHDREVDKVLEYLEHANKILKGRLNPVVQHFNRKMENEEVRLGDLFEFLLSEFGISGKTVDGVKTFASAQEEQVYNDHRDLFRAFASGDKLRRCLKFVEERGLDAIQQKIIKVKPKRFSKMAHLLARVDSRSFPEIADLKALLNSRLNLSELKEFIFTSNTANRNEELLDFISSQGSDLNYLQLLGKVLDLQKRGKARHVLNFIDKDYVGEWANNAIRKVRDLGDLKTGGLLGGELRKLKNSGQARRDNVLALITKYNRGGEMNLVLDALDGKQLTTPLMDKIKSYLKTGTKNPLSKELLQKLAQREPGKAKTNTELTDLMEVLSQNPQLKTDFPQLERLLNEDNKQSRFESTLDFMQVTNMNGRNSLLLRELDPARVAKKLNRGSRQVMGEEHLPNAFVMAEVLATKHAQQPARYQDVLDHFNQADKASTGHDIDAYLKWMNKQGEHDHTLEKIRGKGLAFVLEVIKEEDEDENGADLQGVVGRVDEEGLSHGRMLDFLRKYNPKGAHDEMIGFLEGEKNVGLSKVLDTAGQLNKDGALDDFLTFVRTGGVDLLKTGEFSDNPLFKMLAKYKLLGQFPELFTLLAKRPDLLDPEALLDHLKRKNLNGVYDDLVRELERYVKSNREYPNLGDFNEEHPLTRLIHRKMRNCVLLLRAFNKRKANAERWLAILSRKNSDMQQMRVLKRLGEVAREDQLLEQNSQKRKQDLLHFLKKGCRAKMEGAVQTMLRHKQAKGLSEKVVLGRLLRSARTAKHLTLMRLRAGVTSDKYRKHVTKGYHKKFWGIMIRSMNPGIFQAFLKLREYKEKTVQREYKGQARRRWLAKLLVGKVGLRQGQAMQLLQKNLARTKGLERARTVLAKTLVAFKIYALRAPLSRLREATREVAADEQDNLGLVTRVFGKANTRAQGEQRVLIKNLANFGLKLTLQGERTRAMLQRVFGAGDQNARAIKQGGLRHLRKFSDEEKVREGKLLVWGRLAMGHQRQGMASALNQLRSFSELETLKMAMNSLFKWKIANLNARTETEREMDCLINLHRGCFLDRLSTTQERMLRDALRKLRSFSSQNKTSLSRVLLRLINSTTMVSLQALQKLRTLNSDFNEEESSGRKLIGRLFRALEEKHIQAFSKLRRMSRRLAMRRRMASRVLGQGLVRARERALTQVVGVLARVSRQKKRRQLALRGLLRRLRAKDQQLALNQWRALTRRAKVCRFNGKITAMSLSLRKNHKFELKWAFAQWSRKELRMKYQLMASFLDSAREEKKKETLIHMKILYMQKKFSTMCKVLGTFLDFVERRKRENKMFAFDALCLENPWAEKVPKLLACSRVMSAQMCFWKLKLTRHQFIKKRRQRGGGYKIDKLKLVVLEKIFTKKVSQYFMQIQIGKPNKYL